LISKLVYISCLIDAHILVNETNAALGQMTSDMREVNDILRMQNEHAQNQQAGLNKVEDNLQKAGDELDAGVQEMESARNLRRGWYVA
jgi:methyl-accepting chemotaxis protein